MLSSKIGNAYVFGSLVPRRLRRGRRNAWYTLFAHALISKSIIYVIAYSDVAIGGWLT